MKYLIVGVLALVIVFASVGYFVPLSEVAYAETVDYQDTETYYENEDYQDTETYTVSEPYQDTETYMANVPLKYEIVSKVVTEDQLVTTNTIDIGGIGSSQSTSYTPLYVATVTVKNTDTVNGNFGARFSVVQPLDNYFISSQKIIPANGSDVFECPAYTLGNWDVRIIPPNKVVESQREVTKYRSVEKTRPVTKTRQVEKQRTITKQRVETRYKKVPLFQSVFK